MTEQIPLIDLEPLPKMELPIHPLELFLVLAWQPIILQSTPDVRSVHVKARIEHFRDALSAQKYAANLDPQWRPVFYRVVVGGE